MAPLQLALDLLQHDPAKVVQRGRVQSLMARALRQAGRAVEAEAMLRTALAEQQQRLGPDHPQTLLTTGELATALGAGAMQTWMTLSTQSSVAMEEVAASAHAPLARPVLG